MELENIIELVFPALSPSTVRTRVLGRRTDPGEYGLHFTDPDRYIACPLLRATGAPVSLLEGFRHGRYTSSALFHELDYELLTTISCSLPAFTCTVCRGIPRMVRSPVALPLAELKDMGDVSIVSDGGFIFSRKVFRSGSRTGMTSRRIMELEALESLLDGIRNTLSD